MSQTLAASAGSPSRARAVSRAHTAAHADAARTPSRGPARAPRPTLRVVAAPVTERGRTLFVLGALGLLVGGLITLLMVNTALAQGSFRMHDLRATSRQLADQSQALNEDIATQASPQRLSAKAAALGMVPSGSVAFLRLSDGRVLGVAQPAPKPAAPTVTTQAPTTQPAPQRKKPTQPTQNQPTATR